MTRQSRWRALSDFKLLRIFMAGRLPRSNVFWLSDWYKTGGSPRGEPQASQGADSYLPRARRHGTSLEVHRCEAVLWDVILFLIGLILAWLTLRDVFDTVVVPGGSRASLQVTRHVGGVLLALYKLVR